MNKIIHILLLLLILFAFTACDGLTPPSEEGDLSLAETILQELEADLTAYTESQAQSVSGLSYILPGGCVGSIMQEARNKLMADGLLESSNLAEVLPAVMEGGQKGLSEVAGQDQNRTEAINVIQGSLLESVAGKSKNLPPENTQNYATPVQEVICRVADSSISNMQQAGISEMGLELAAVASTQTILVNMKKADVLQGEAAGTAGAAIEAIVSALDNLQDIDVGQVMEFTGKIAGGAAQVLDEMGYSELVIDNEQTKAVLSEIMKASLQASSLMENYTMSLSDFEEVAGNVVMEVSGALDKFYSPSQLAEAVPDMLKEVPALAMQVMDEIGAYDLQPEVIAVLAGEMAGSAMEGIGLLTEVDLGDQVISEVAPGLAAKLIEAVDGLAMMDLDDTSAAQAAYSISENMKQGAAAYYEAAMDATVSGDLEQEIVKGIFSGLKETSGVQYQDSTVYNTISVAIHQAWEDAAGPVADRPILLGPLVAKNVQVPQFFWSIPEGTTSFWLIVADGPDVSGSTQLINELYVYSDHYDSDVTFESGKTYWWKVKHRIGATPADRWSTIESFTVE